MSQDAISLNVPTLASGSGAPTAMTGRTQAVVEVDGTFVGTVTVEVRGLGTVWKAVAAGITAPGMVAIPYVVQQVRVTVSGYVSGQPLAWVHFIVGDS